MPEPLRRSGLDWTVHPPYLHAAYGSTVSRAPRQPLLPRPATLSEATGPLFGASAINPLDHDLTKNGVKTGEPLGERIIVAGRVLDDRGQPVPGALVEVWQANACGRYIHQLDQHDAPLDPNFTGRGRVLTNDEGEYRFLSIRPGAYPWNNHPNAWRPAHIHFSLFGECFSSRLVTQMYFPGDPLLPFDPILCGVPTEQARERLIASFDVGITQAGFALGYRFDIVLCGSRMTPFENLSP